MIKIIFSLLILFAAQSDEFKPQGLLTFSKEIPIEQTVSVDEPYQPRRNQNIAEEKRFPIETVLLSLLFASCFLALRYYPREKKEEVIAIKTSQDKAKAQLEKLQ